MPYHPDPHIIICTSFHLINWLQRFYRITMSLKRPFVPKSDVKQWFTTTTFNTCANAAPVSVKALPVQCDYSAGTDVGRGSLETTMLDITCLTRDEWNYPELLLLWELSDPRIAELLLNKKRLWTSGHAHIRRVKENTLNNPPCPVTLTSSCTSIISSMDCTVIIVLQSHLNCH